MKLTTAAALAVITFGLTLGTSDAEAQFVSRYNPWSDTGVAASPALPYAPSYSYWSAAYYGYPPRIYVPIGSNDFPYYGRPYGSPSDPWSWPAMAEYAFGVPTRYNLYIP